MLAAVLTTVLLAGPAPAQSAGVDLDWEAPAGCPSQGVVLSRLRTIVGKSVDGASRLRAHGRVVRADAGYRLTLKVREGTATIERVIESNSCADLAGAAAIALGLLVRDELAAHDAPGNGEPRAGGSTASGEARAAGAAATSPDATLDGGNTGRREARAPEERLAAEPVKAAARNTRFLLRAPQLGIDVGPLPRPSPTFGLSAGVSFRALELTLGARMGLAQAIWVNGNPTYGAELRRAAFELRGCHMFPSGRFSFAPCLFAALDPLSARGVGDQVSSQTRTTVIFAAGAAALGRVRLGEFLALIASVGAQVELSRPRLVIEGLGDVDQLAPFALTTSTAVEWSL